MRECWLLEYCSQLVNQVLPAAAGRQPHHFPAGPPLNPMSFQITNVMCLPRTTSLLLFFCFTVASSVVHGQNQRVADAKNTSTGNAEPVMDPQLNK